MSRFFSRKVLAYREMAQRPAIDEDVFCRHCGYNLRGLKYGANCPECGNVIELRGALHDVLLDHGAPARARWRTGFSLLLTAGLCVTILPVVDFLLRMNPPLIATSKLIAPAAVGVALLWTVAILVVTPPLLEIKWRWMRAPRRLIRVLTFGAIIAATFAAIDAFSSVPGGLDLLRGPALVAAAFGGMVLVYLLGFIASEAELSETENRLRLALWVLPFTAIAVVVFAALNLPWNSLKAVPMVLIIPAIIYGVWIWSMYLLLRSAWEMREHVRWADVIAAAGIGREERIAQQRRAIEQAVEGTIRPLPENEGEEWPDRPTEATDPTN